MTNIEIYKQKLELLKNLESNLIQNHICPEEKTKQLINILEDKINNFKPKMMVYGVYNSGKSTVINALVGKELAKTGDTPETKEINVYKYKEYEIFDTPGINAPADDEKITEDHYKQCELVLFVMSNENVENDFIYTKIKKMLDDNKASIVILNKKQICTEEEEAILINKIYLNLVKMGFKEEDVKNKISVYSVNALSAFNAKLNNKTLLYEKSGFEALENKIKELFKNSSEADIVNLCNNNILSFVDQINSLIDQKIDDKIIQIVENFISDTQKNKNATFIQLKGIINSELSAVENKLVAQSGDSSYINSTLENAVNELKSKIETKLKERIKDFEEHIKNLDVTLDKLETNRIELSNTSLSGGGISKQDIEKWLSVLDTLAIALATKFPPAAAIIDAISQAGKILSSLFFDDDTEEKNQREQSKKMQIVNAIHDTIIKIQNNFDAIINEQVNAIYDPIIEKKTHEKELQEQNKNTLIVLKDQVVSLGQNLPSA